MKALALDVGTKTIGVAKCDPRGLFPIPVTTLKRRSVKHDSAAIAKLVETHKATIIVVGMPYELDGTEGRSARLARQIGEAVSALTSLPVEYVDERYSSVEAERTLISLDMSRKRRKEVIDQAAAMVILETWINSRNSTDHIV